MRFSRSRSISRRIRLLHEYGTLASKKLAMNLFGAFVFLAGSLLGAQHISAEATSTSPLTTVDSTPNQQLRRSTTLGTNTRSGQGDAGSQGDSELLFARRVDGGPVILSFGSFAANLRKSSAI